MTNKPEIREDNEKGPKWGEYKEKQRNEGENPLIFFYSMERTHLLFLTF